MSAGNIIMIEHTVHGFFAVLLTRVVLYCTRYLNQHGLHYRTYFFPGVGFSIRRGAIRKRGHSQAPPPPPTPKTCKLLCQILRVLFIYMSFNMIQAE